MNLVIKPLNFKLTFNYPNTQYFEAECLGCVFSVDYHQPHSDKWNLTIEVFKKTVFDEWFSSKELAMLKANDWLQDKIEQIVTCS